MKRNFSVSVWSILAAAALTASSVHAADLEIDVKGVQAGKGQIMLALYDSAEKFLRHASRTMAVPAAEAAVQIKVEGLPPGDYAVSLYQDLNSNNKLDTYVFGIPSEPYAFSNNAAGNFGPPTFDAARITIPSGGKKIAITLHK